MKKAISILFLLALFFTTSQAGVIKDNIQGVWGDKEINLTFTGDTLYIDEIGNEGFCYAYQETLKGDTLKVSNKETIDTFNIIVVSLDKTTLVCYIDGKKVELHKKQHNEYN